MISRDHEQLLKQVARLLRQGGKATKATSSHYSKAAESEKLTELHAKGILVKPCPRPGNDLVVCREVGCRQGAISKS